jgi:hypothetical protein
MFALVAKGVSVSQVKLATEPLIEQLADARSRRVVFFRTAF